MVIYTFKKDSKARRQSVLDDYWLRKVVGPIAIEPMLKVLLEMIASTPPSFGTEEFSEAALSEYHQKYLKALSDLAINSSSLSIIDPTLAASTALEIDQIQDLMIEYCATNKKMHSTDDLHLGHDRRSFQVLIQARLVDLLKPIRTYQEHKVGKNIGV